MFGLLSGQQRFLDFSPVCVARERDEQIWFSKTRHNSHCVVIFSFHEAAGVGHTGRNEFSLAYMLVQQLLIDVAICTDNLEVLEPLELLRPQGFLVRGDVVQPVLEHL